MSRQHVQTLLAICFASVTLPGFAAYGQDASATLADRVSVPQLMKNLDFDNVKVAASAARSLGVVFAPGGKGGDEREDVIKMLIDRLDSPRGALLRKECAVAVGRIRAKEAAEKLKSTMNDEDVEVAMAAGAAIGQILPVDEARTFLIERGDDESEIVRVAVMHGLAPIAKPEDAPFLVQGLAAGNWRARMSAVKGLERAVRAGAELSPEDYDAVASVFGSEITNASNAAVHFFTHIRNDESFRALLNAVDTQGDGSSQDTSWRTRTYSLRAIHHMRWPSNREALPAVIRQLGDNTSNVTNEARRILNTLRKEHYVSQADLFPLFLAELEKAEPLRLRGAIMQEMGSHVDRQYASRVADAASTTLTEAINEKSQWPARAYAITLLGASGYSGSIEEIARCVSDDVPNVRRAAGQALETLGPLCPSAEREKVAPILHPLLTKPVDWRKTAVAARSAGSYANSETIEPLVRLLDHSVLNVRQGASHALVQVGGGEDEQLRTKVNEAVYPGIEQTPRAWEYGAPVLGAARCKDAKAVPLLTKILENGDWRSQASAADAVTQIAGASKINDKPLSDALIRASQSEVLQVQDAANRALRELTKEG